MREKIKRFSKSPWTLALMPVLFGTMLTAIYDAIKDKPILSTLWGWIKTIWGWIVAFLNFELKVWWVLIGISVIIAVLIIISKLSNEKENTLPSFTSYKEDIFGEWKWSWDWHLNSYDKKWHVDNLRAHCPKCDTPMFHDNSDIRFQCPRCGFETNWGSNHKNRFEVEAIIIDNLERKKKDSVDV